MRNSGLIGILRENGTIDAIYLHQDANWGYAGRILHTHYQDESKVEELVSSGSLHILKKNVGEEHDGSWRMRSQHQPFHQWMERYRNHPHREMCEFYERDLGSTSYPLQRYRSLKEFERLDSYTVEFVYLFWEDGLEWYGSEVKPSGSRNGFYGIGQSYSLEWRRLADVAKRQWIEGVVPDLATLRT